MTHQAPPVPPTAPPPQKSDLTIEEIRSVRDLLARREREILG